MLPGGLECVAIGEMLNVYCHSSEAYKFLYVKKTEGLGAESLSILEGRILLLQQQNHKSIDFNQQKSK